MADQLNSSWEQAQHKSFADLKKEADEQKAKRENMQPMALGKGQYANIFKVGDRLRPDMALWSPRGADAETGTGTVDLYDLIPKQAFKDLDHAFAQANMIAQQETQEGIREVEEFDKDEAEVKGWQEPKPKLVLNPPVESRDLPTIESAAFSLEEGEDAV